LRALRFVPDGERKGAVSDHVRLVEFWITPDLTSPARRPLEDTAVQISSDLTISACKYLKNSI
jgi:hypothetical protein